MAQFRKDTQELLGSNKTIYEVVMLSTNTGNVVSLDNPLPVSIAEGANITITGAVTIPGSIEISNDESSPIPTHTHLFDENEDEYTDSNPLTVDGTVNIGTMPNVTINQPVAVTDNGGSLTVDGSVSVTGNVNIGTMPTVNAAIVGTVTQTVVPAAADAFGRTRVSETWTLGDYSHVYGEEQELLSKTSGAASNTELRANEASIRLTCGSESDAYVIHQSRMYHHYMPGKSQLTFASFAFGPPRANTEQRVGLYGNRDGAYFMQDGDGDYYFVIRGSVTGSVVDTPIAQSTWNIDRCDGTGDSGFDINPELSQLFYMDYQWLGVGRIRLGFVHNGQVVIAHEVYNSNQPGVSTVYWSNPSLPIRCEIRNVGATTGTAYMDQMCATVMSEGGYKESGVDFAAASDAVALDKTAPDNIKGIIAIRLKNTYQGLPNRSIVRLQNIDIFADSASCRWELWRLPDSTGVTAGSWTDVNTSSVVEYNATMTGYDLTGAEKQNSGWIAANNPSGKQASGQTSPDTSTAKRSYLSNNIDATDSTTYLLVVKNLSTSATTNIYAAMQWRETR